jgi:hypothetical protein
MWLLPDLVSALPESGVFGQGYSPLSSSTQYQLLKSFKDDNRNEAETNMMAACISIPTTSYIPIVTT